MADLIVDLNLLRNPRSLSVIGNSIYGSVILDGPANDLGSELCCIKKGSCKYTGEASEWMPHVLDNNGKGGAHFVTINGEIYVVKSISTIDRFSSYKDKDVFNLNELRRSMVKNPAITKSCVGVLGDFKYKYIGLDNFATEVINATVIDEAFESTPSMPKLYNKIVSYSLCGRAGLILMEEADQTDMESFLQQLSKQNSEMYEVQLSNKTKSTFPGVKREVIVPMVKQVLSALDFLQKKVEFIHSELLANNVLVHSEACKGTYEGVNLKGAYTAKIADYSHSSCSISSKNAKDPKVRIFNEYRVTRFLPVTPSYEVKTKTNQICQVNVGRGQTCSDVFWWTLPSSFNVKTSLITQHSGMPFYRSYDAYTFIVSLMLCPRFYYTIISSENSDLFQAIWAPLWLPKELEKVTKLVEKNLNEKISLALVLDIIGGLSLRCDALDVLLSNLKAL